MGTTWFVRQLHDAGGGEAGIGEGFYRPGAGKHVVGELGGERGISVFEGDEPPGRRHLGGGILGEHAGEEVIAKGGGQHAGPADVIVLDPRPVLRRMFGDVLGKVFEHGIDRRPVGRIGPIGLLAPRKKIGEAFHPLDHARAVMFEALDLGQEASVLRGADRPLLERQVDLCRKRLAGRHPDNEIGHRQRPCLIRLSGRVPRVVLLALIDPAQQEPRGLIAEIGIEGALLDQLAGEAGLAGRQFRVVWICLEKFGGIRIKEETAVSGSFLTV